MKKFFIKIVFFLLGIFCIVTIINALYMRNYEFETIKNVPEEIEICNFGNSQPYNGIDYSITNQWTCFNFALPAQSFSYDLRILERYKDKIKPGAKVLICCSFHSFFGKPETENADFASKNRRYYYFLPKELIKEYDLTTDIMVRYLPALTARETLIPTILGVYKNNKEEIFYTTKTEAASTAQARYENLFRSARNNDDNSIVFNEEDIDCLVQMIDLVKALGCEPILFTTPYLKEYVEEIKERDPELLDVFYEIINDICQKKAINYFDWSEDSRFCSSYELFVNLDHLNQNGAKVFTSILLDTIIV